MKTNQCRRVAVTGRGFRVSVNGPVVRLFRVNKVAAVLNLLPDGAKTTAECRRAKAQARRIASKCMTAKHYNEAVAVLFG